MPTKRADYFSNTGGLNTTDSPLFVNDGQATGGFNYDYGKTGGVTKIFGLSKINGVADTQLLSLGLGYYFPISGSRQLIRYAGTKIETCDIDAGTFTVLAEDTASGNTDFINSSSTQQVVTSQFNSSVNSILWAAGGGMAVPYGYNGTKVIRNGITAPTGTFTVVNNGASTGGLWIATGNYFYALALRKASTQAVSNAALDQLVIIANVSNSVTLTLPTGVDTTKYDKWYIYRSSVGGVTNFTAGDLIAQLSTTSPTYTDLGESLATSQVVPRPGSTSLDNSPLPEFTPSIVNWAANASFVASNTIAFTINGITFTQPFITDNATTLAAIAAQMATSTVVASAVVSGLHSISIIGNSATPVSVTASVVTGGASQATITVTTLASAVALSNYNHVVSYKRRLVAARGSTIQISDLDKPESWPVGLAIPVPSGGPITGMSVIGYNSPSTGSTDEYLVIWKERETWIITGTAAFDSTTNLYDVELIFIDNVGCLSQALSARFNGFITWLDVRGIYVWSGVGKPIYVSRPIEALFGSDGDIDKVNLSRGWAVYFRKKSQVVWTISDRMRGVNSVQLKLDIRLTIPKLGAGAKDANIVEGVFSMDSPGTKLYSGVSFLPTDQEELFIVGDDSGNIYKNYYAGSNNGVGIDFQYDTKFYDQSAPTEAKQYDKVVVFVEEASASSLTLQYWADYRSQGLEASSIEESMESPTPIKASRWDLAIWDVSFWDEFSSKIVPVTFNLSGAENNNQGDSIRLRFIQSDIDSPCTIYGWSIYYDDIATRH